MLHKCGTGVVAVRELWEVKLPGVGNSLGMEVGSEGVKGSPRDTWQIFLLLLGFSGRVG